MNYSFGNRYGGNYYSVTFGDLFPNPEGFIEEYKQDCPLSTGKNTVSDEALTQLYYILWARYGNSHFNSLNNENIKGSIFSLIYMYGPTWERRVELQNKIRTLTDDEIITGNSAIHTHADDPGTLAKTADDITYIDSKNTTTYKKGKIEGLALAQELLSTDVTKEFINKFQYLFTRVLIPYAPLYYETEITEEGDED